MNMLNMKLFFLLAGLAFMLGWGAHALFLAPPGWNLVTGAVVGVPDAPQRSEANTSEWTTSAWATSAWTKAICDNNNFCIDVLITCENGKVVALMPIMNGTRFSGGWEDPRPEELKDAFC